MPGAAKGHLRCEDVRVAFGGVVALAGVSIEVAPGSCTGLIGPNGSGKTTLLNVVSGVQRAQRGRVVLDGRDIERLPLAARARAGVGRTFQTLRLFDTLSVIENVALGAHRLCRTSLAASCLFTPASLAEQRRIRADAEELLSVFGDRLLPRLSHQVVALSYANRRRVEIARALMSRPSVLLLDEPAAGMNPAETEELGEHLRRLIDLAGCSALVVEHKMDFIGALCGRAYVLDHGVCLAEGTPEAVQRDPAVAEAFLGVE